MCVVSVCVCLTVCLSRFWQMTRKADNFSCHNRRFRLAGLTAQRSKRGTLVYLYYIIKKYSVVSVSLSRFWKSQQT